MSPSKTALRRWIIIGAAVLLAAAAFVLFFPGLTTSDYIKYRMVSGKYREAGILESEMSGFSEPVTRYEFAQLINRAFGLTATSELSFTDTAGEEQTLEMNRAVTQGYLTAEDGAVQPDAAITRQQTAVALAALLRLPAGSATLLDAGEADADALPAVMAAVEQGLLEADSECFRPGDPLTGSEAVLMLQAAVGTPFREAGAYTSRSGDTLRGNATLSADGVALCNATVTGDVYITEGVGGGSVTLENLRVEGRIVIAGATGGVLLNGVTCGQVVVDTASGDPVRVVAMGDSRLGSVEARSPLRLEEADLTGDGFMNLSVTAGNLRIEAASQLDEVELSGSQTELWLEEGASAGSVTAQAPARITGGGTIGQLIALQGPLTCDMIPDTADIRVADRVTLAGEVFAGEATVVSGRELKAVMADAEALSAAMTGADGEAVPLTENLALPLQGDGGSVITWQSSDAAHLSETGVITRADYPLGDFPATLTAQVTCGQISKTLGFRFLVLQKEITPQQAVEIDAQAIELKFGPGDDASGIIHDLTLPVTGENGTAITWSSSNNNALSAMGKVTRSTTTDRTVTLTATVTREDATATREFKVVVRKKTAYTDKELLEEDKDTLYIVYAPGDSAGSVTQSLLLPGSGLNGSVVTWKTSASQLVSAAGAVTRPAAEAGNQTVTLTATLNYNGLTTTKAFTVVVTAPEPVATPTPAVTPTASPDTTG